MENLASSLPDVIRRLERLQEEVNYFFFNCLTGVEIQSRDENYIIM